MRDFTRIAALLLVALVISGCAGYPDRRLIFDQLNPAPMSDRAWAQVRGSYTGPIRSTTQRTGFEAASSMEVRLDLSGYADDPGVFLKIENGYSTAWALYGQRKGAYTNIPSKWYGGQGTIYASTHAPNQLLIKTRRYGLSAGTGNWFILTFRPRGVIDVELIGHSGWRGDGELWRVPVIPHDE
jgi:hypothetical protein